MSLLVDLRYRSRVPTGLIPALLFLPSIHPPPFVTFYLPAHVALDHLAINVAQSNAALALPRLRH